MKAPDLQFSDPELQKAYQALSSVLGNVSKDNLKGVVLTGTTNGSADTKQKFRHGLGAVPGFWFPLEGDVYVPKDGFSENEVDLRSRLTSHSFKVLVVK